MLGNTRIHVRLAPVVAVLATAAALLVPTASATRLITDTLAPGGSSASVSHFIPDTLAPGGGASSVVSVPTGTGFRWADAGIGAAVACALMLLALMGPKLARRRRGQLAY
jgi:hypothetical protein